MASRSKFRTEVFHEGLGKSQIVAATKADLLEKKASRAWANMEALHAKQKTQKAIRERAALDKAGQTSAERQTYDAEQVRTSLDHILLGGLDRVGPVPWNEKKSIKPFDERPPELPPGKEPSIDDHRYQPDFGLMGRFFASIRRQRIADAQAQFETDHREWQKRQDRVRSWEDRRRKHIGQQEERRAAIEYLLERYRNGEHSAIEEHAELVLSRSQYPDFVPKEFEVQFFPNPGRVLVKRYLPDATSIPTLKKVTYVKSRSEFREYSITDKEKMIFIIRFFAKSAFEPFMSCKLLMKLMHMN